MPPARFLRDYWQKHPLLVRNALPDFAPPLSPGELAGLACMDGALARIILRRSIPGAKAGKPVSRRRGNDGMGSLAPRRHEDKSRTDDRWAVHTGPFDDDTFAKLPESRWTLLVQDVDKWDDATAALLDRFAFIPRWRVDDVMVSYAADGGGVGAHVDQYDVFLLQGNGRRKWRISIDPHAATDLREDVELKLLRRFSPTHAWTLEPGDMLYLPPGIPHDGVAIGECMTYSIGMRAPSAAEMLLDFAEYVAQSLPDSLRYRDSGLRPAGGDGEIDDDAIARVRAVLAGVGLKTGDEQPVRKRAPSGQEGFARNVLAQEHVGGVEGFARAAPASLLRTWFGRFITHYRSDFDFDADAAPMPNTAFAHAVDRGAMIEIAPRARAAWQREQHGATLFVVGRAWACSTRLARRIASRRPFALGGFARSTTDRDVLRALAGCGIIRLQRDRKPKR